MGNKVTRDDICTAVEVMGNTLGTMLPAIIRHDITTDAGIAALSEELQEVYRPHLQSMSFENAIIAAFLGSVLHGLKEAPKQSKH